MAATHDNTVLTDLLPLATTQTLSNFTVGAGANRVLYAHVAVHIQTEPLADVTGVTFGAQALTKIATADEGSRVRVTLWRLIAPNETTADVTVSIDAAAPCRITARSYSGVDQTTPNRAVDTATGSGGSVPSGAEDLTAVSESGDTVLDGGSTDGGRDITATAGQTIRAGPSNTGDLSTVAGELTATGTSTSSSYNFSAGDQHAFLIYALIDASGAPPQNVAVNPAVETDAAQAVALQAALVAPIAVAAETDSAEAITVQAATVAYARVSWVEFETPGLASLTAVVGRARETDVALAIPRAQVITLDAAIEADAAQVVTVVISAQVAAATEADAALALAVALSTTLAPALELDAAQAVAAAVTLAIGAATESDTAQDVVVAVGSVVAVGTASEGDSAEAITAVTSAVVAVGVATESDEALALGTGTGLFVAVGAAAETDEARTLGVAPTFAAVLGVATESDEALALGTGTGLFVAVVGATEIDAAQTITVQAGGVVVALGTATETDTAQTVTNRLSTAIGVGAEVDNAETIPALQGLVVALGPAIEADAAQTIVPATGGIAAPIATAVETDAAQGITSGLALPAAPALEADLAIGLALATGPVTVLVDVATEADSAGSAKAAGGFGKIATWVESTRPDRWSGSIRPDPWAGSTRPDRWGQTVRADAWSNTTRPDQWVGSARPDRWATTVRPDHFFETVFYREGTTVALTFVALGPYTQGEIPEPLLIRVLETRRDDTTAGMQLFNQVPAWTATVFIDGPDGTPIVSGRAVTILDPGQLTTLYPNDFTGAEDGWLRMNWANGDLDVLSSSAPGDYEVQIKLDNGTLRLKSVDVWRPEVNDAPAAAVGA